MGTKKDDAMDESKNGAKDEASEKSVSTDTEEDQKAAPAEKGEAQKEPESTKQAETMEKPLEKMTVKDLREMAKEMPEITGVHGMKKEELIVAIKEAKGIKDEPVKKADASVRELKKKIKALKAERRTALEASDKKMATIYKRRISRLKKKSRKAAA